MSVRMFSLLHHYGRVGRESQPAFAITKQHGCVVAVVTDVNEVEVAIAVQITEDHLTGTFGSRRSTSGGLSKPALALAEHHRNVVRSSDCNNEISPPVFIHVADDYVARSTRHCDRRRRRMCKQRPGGDADVGFSSVARCKQENR